MSGEKAQFTSDRRAPGKSSWDSESDWVVGTAESVDVANGRLYGRVPDQSSQIPDDGVLYDEGVNEDAWIKGESEGDPISPLGGELTKEADHLFAAPVPNPDDINCVSWIYNVPIDFTDYNKIVVESASQENEGSVAILLSPNTNLDYPNRGGLYKIGYRTPYNRKTDTMDVSDISGVYYLHLASRDNATFTAWPSEAEFYYVGLNV